MKTNQACNKILHVVEHPTGCGESWQDSCDDCRSRFGGERPIIHVLPTTEITVVTQGADGLEAAQHIKTDYERRGAYFARIFTDGFVFHKYRIVGHWRKS